MGGEIMSLSYQQLLVAVPLVLQGGNVPNIVGEAGIGKSALVVAVASQMQAKLFTTVVSLSEKGDLVMPIPPLTANAFVMTSRYGELADVKYGYTHTLIEIIAQAEAHPGQPILWFLDEFNRGSQAVQSELMNLVLQRQINSLQLPAEVQIILAENPDSDMPGFEESNYAVMAGDAAIKDRTTRLVMCVDVADWLQWAKTEVAGRPVIHPLVTAYIATTPDTLFPRERGADLNPTPRAWQRVSDNLYELEKLAPKMADQLIFDIVAGDLGTLHAQLFVQYWREQGTTLSMAELFAPDFKGTQFNDLSEVTKIALLKQALLEVTLTDASNATRFKQLLEAAAPDSRYVVVKAISRELLNELYNAKSHSTEELYQLISEVALDAD